MILSKVNLLAIVVFLLFVLIIYYKDQFKLVIRLFEKNQNKSYFKIYPGSIYKKSCLNLYSKLRFPNKKLFFDPPLKKPPADMLDEFTQHGKMPVKKWLHINEIYSDSKGENKKIKRRIINSIEIDDLRKKVKTNQPLVYGDRILNEIMHFYEKTLINKSLAVIGTQIPWIEAIGLETKCSSITTLDYTRAEYKYPNMKWLHVNDYLDEAISNRSIEEFDVIASFSSLEHSGLGRYGDPINPYGDIEAMSQIHCMLKPGGLFFLALPTNDDGSSHIEFNAHRVYGKERLNLLFEGWNNLIKKKDSFGVHTIFVLQKNSLK